MSNEKQEDGQSGGFHFGAIGGSVTQTAGGDIVGRDKITHYHELPHEKQLEVQSDLLLLRNQLKVLADMISADQLKTSTELADVRHEVSARLSELDKVDSALNSKAEDPSTERLDVGQYLNKATETLNRVSNITTATTSLASKIASIASQALPYIVSLKALLGL